MQFCCLSNRKKFWAHFSFKIREHPWKNWCRCEYRPVGQLATRKMRIDEVLSHLAFMTNLLYVFSLQKEKWTIFLGKLSLQIFFSSKKDITSISEQIYFLSFIRALDFMFCPYFVQSDYSDRNNFIWLTFQSGDVKKTVFEIFFSANLQEVQWIWLWFSFK